MEKRTNAGYVITDSIKIGDTEVVLGEHPKTAAPYVTWLCKNENNYFWGHYFMTRNNALNDMVKRAEKELSFHNIETNNRLNNRKRGEERWKY